MRITSNSPMFVQNNNLYGTGAFLSPQQSEPEIVVIELPPGTRIAGFSYQSAAATVELEKGHAFDLAAVPAATLGFFGVAQDTPIDSLKVTVDGPGIDLDDLYHAADYADTDGDGVPNGIDDYPEGRFTDAPQGFWAFRHIEHLARAGITGGCGEDTYCPEAFVNRAQMGAEDA